MTARGEWAGCWALVPVKRLDRAKSRLADVFAPAERAELVQAMLRDVLEALAGVRGLAGVLVVSDDDAAASLARCHRARLLGDPAGGLNAAVWHGMRWLATRGAGSILVAPGDIPFASVGEFESVVSALQASPVVLAPARRDGGTNILGLAPPAGLVPRFGPASFARHREAARTAGIEPLTILLPGAGHDVDVAADLHFEARGETGRHTRTFLNRPVAERMRAHAGILEGEAFQ